MASNAQKTPLVSTLNQFATGKALAEIRQQGRSLPCTVAAVQGAIVEVNFEVNSGFTLPIVTMPVIGSEYVRLPIQPGCKGWAIAADAYLGGMSGLGGGVADLTQRANLATLVFSPIGNSAWPSVDGNAVTIYGPNGAVLRDSGSACVFTLTPNGIVINLPGGAKTVQLVGLPDSADGLPTWALWYDPTSNNVNIVPPV